MFTALFFKEWREKALVFFFELGILILLLGAQFFVREKKDIQEWLIYAMLLLFFPFAALILGTAGFEAEYRQGAWAYLFSRPMGRISIWLTKFAALLSMFAGLWVVFVAAWTAFPGIREMVAGPGLFLNYAAESGFPLWSVGLSAFFLVVSFSLSPLHGRQFNVLFAAVALGLAFPAGARLVLVSKSGGFLAWLDPSRAMTALILSQVLIALAFAAASILTLVRSDFSQPRKQAASFVRWFAPFLVVAVAVTAAWVRFAPAPAERYSFAIGFFQGEPYYQTDRGLVKYSGPKDRVERLTRRHESDYSVTAVGGGKIAYTLFDIHSRSDVSMELWVAGVDGRDRKRIMGGKPEKTAWPWGDVPLQEMSFSPDGSRIAILTANPYGKRRTQPRPLLWLVRADGSGVESLPDSSGLYSGLGGRAYFHLVAWTPDSQALILWRRNVLRPWTTTLWRYDVETRTARLIHDNAISVSWRGSLSPGGDRLAIKYQKTPEELWTLAVLDLETLAIVDVGDQETKEAGYLSQVSWSPKGDGLAYVVREKRAEGPAAYSLRVYSLDDQRVIAEKEMARTEGTALILDPTWTADGKNLVVFDRDTGSLRLLGPELRDLDRITLPRGLKVSRGMQAVDNKILVTLDSDGHRDSLWRLDLTTKRWKRLY
jgi:hypothetical protein